MATAARPIKTEDSSFTQAGTTPPSVTDTILSLIDTPDQISPSNLKEIGDLIRKATDVNEETIEVFFELFSLLSSDMKYEELFEELVRTTFAFWFKAPRETMETIPLQQVVYPLQKLLLKEITLSSLCAKTQFAKDCYVKQDAEVVSHLEKNPLPDDSTGEYPDLTPLQIVLMSFYDPFDPRTVFPKGSTHIIIRAFLTHQVPTIMKGAYNGKEDGPRYHPLCELVRFANAELVSLYFTQGGQLPHSEFLQDDIFTTLTSPNMVRSFQFQGLLSVLLANNVPMSTASYKKLIALLKTNLLRWEQVPEQYNLIFHQFIKTYPLTNECTIHYPLFYLHDTVRHTLLESGFDPSTQENNKDSDGFFPSLIAAYEQERKAAQPADKQYVADRAAQRMVDSLLHIKEKADKDFPFANKAPFFEWKLPCFEDKPLAEALPVDVRILLIEQGHLSRKLTKFS